MIGQQSLLWIFLLVSFAAAKMDVSKLNATTFRKPSIKNTSPIFKPFFDDSFCDDHEDNDFFPHPDACWYYVYCFGGILNEGECPWGQNFDPIGLFCDDEEYVDCDPVWWPDEPDSDPDCPPPDSSEVRFLPSEFCDEYYICINGQPILLQCREGV